MFGLVVAIAIGLYFAVTFVVYVGMPTVETIKDRLKARASFKWPLLPATFETGNFHTVTDAEYGDRYELRIYFHYAVEGVVP
jgi:hypothetical protein